MPRRTHDDPLAAFHPAVRDWFRAALGSPTKVQRLAWPHLAAGDSALVLAPTGSGKTLAAFLALLDRLARRAPSAPRKPGKRSQVRESVRVLYISPLKALATDVDRNLRAPLAGIRTTAAREGAALRDITTAVRTGDTSSADRAKVRRAPPDILITTPESLYLMLTSGQREALAEVETVVIDEIHQLAGTKRGAHLFLSLERLEAAREAERPMQRVGLSATQRPLDEIATLLGGFGARGRRRAVRVIDGSEPKRISVTVDAPEPPDPAADDKSVWPDVHDKLVRRIRDARSTMVFVNSRRLSERLAGALNEVAGEEIALAHHGSVSKDKRAAIEDRLKAGDLPAIVATSSLELGIDMGAVDQVVQIEAPPSIASGIQRIGRAGHQVGAVSSGVIIPKHKADLLAAAACVRGIEDGDVEETFYPRNPLDVLAQQLVATVASGLPARVGKSGPSGVHVDDLFALVRRAAPFAELPRSAFDGVLDMLSGRYPSADFADLKPRLTWDRTRGVVTARPGALRLAIQNAGTIPDRGLYGVFIDDGAEGSGATSASARGSKRVGELDEEMVFELREGEVFTLGATSWRAETITRDRVLVSPAAGVPGKLPFWKGDRVGRSAAFGARVGHLTREIAKRPRGKAVAWLEREHRLSTRAAEQLADYVLEQVAATGVVPSDRAVLVERVPDELGDLRVCVMTPFGGRVHAPWALATLRKLRRARAGDIEAVWSDEGMIFRVPGGDGPPDLDELIPSPEEIDELVTQEVSGSSMFAARFREAAGRALLLPRAMAGKRTPLWAQRKRSADLMAVASRYPSFPIVLETYRECLRDVFNMPALTTLLRDITTRDVKVTLLDAPRPSPFAASLLFSFVGSFLYDDDAPAAERRAQALTVDHERLRELLGETELRKLLDPAGVVAHVRALQRLDYPVGHADAVHDLLLLLGDLGADELAERVDGGEARLAVFLAELTRDRRVLEVSVGRRAAFIAAEDAGRYRDALGVMLPRGVPEAFLAKEAGALKSLVARYARTHGPFTPSDVASRFGVGIDGVSLVLDELVAEGRVLSGAFLPEARRHAGVVEPELCDAEVLRALRQKSLAKLRREVAPVDAAAFTRLLCDWHGLRAIDDEDEPANARRAIDALLTAVERLGGCPLPASVLETELLPARVPGYDPFHLDHLLATGAVRWAGVEPIGPSDGRVALYLAGDEALLRRAVTEPRQGELYDKLRALLAQRGALFFSDITHALGTFPGELLDALWDLVWAGEVTNDTFTALRSMLDRKRPSDTKRVAMRRARALGLGRPASAGPPGSEGRWSLRVDAHEISPTDRAMALAATMLERYGVLLREAAHAEGVVGGFSAIYPVLRSLEEAGRVRRGCFVAGSGATQFAAPGAVDRMRAASDLTGRVVVLAATDPANPYGALLPWPKAEREGGGAPKRTPGARVVLCDGALLAWLGRDQLVTFFGAPSPENAPARGRLARALGLLGGGGAMTLGTIDGVAAPDHPFARELADAGFAARQGKLVRLASTRPRAHEGRVGA